MADGRRQQDSSIQSPEVYFPLDSPAVTADRLQDVSDRLCGTPIYGETAMNLLDERRHEARKDSWAVMKEQPGRAGWSLDMAYSMHMVRIGGLCSPKDNANLQRRDVEAGVSKTWPRTAALFEAPELGQRRAPPPGESGIEWTIRPGPVTKARLAWFLNYTGIAESNLAGAIGKSHRVLKAVAGQRTRQTAAAESQSQPEFVDNAELWELLAGSGLKAYYKNEIRSAVDTSVLYQMEHGETLGGDELVVEGLGAWVARGSRRILRFERIARDGLAHLLDHTEPHTLLDAKAFLRQHFG